MRHPPALDALVPLETRSPMSNEEVKCCTVMVEEALVAGMSTCLTCCMPLKQTTKMPMLRMCSNTATLPLTTHCTSIPQKLPRTWWDNYQPWVAFVPLVWPLETRSPMSREEVKICCTVMVEEALVTGMGTRLTCFMLLKHATEIPMLRMCNNTATLQLTTNCTRIPQKLPRTWWDIH